MLRERAVGTLLPAVTMTIERGRLRLFAKATGQTDPIYTQVDAANAAGLPDLPVPPTFLSSIEQEVPDPFAWLAELGVDLRMILHGEQAFSYHAMAFAGDTLTAEPRIADTYVKRGGALEFIVKQTAIRRADGEAVADLESVIVVRHPEVVA